MVGRRQAYDSMVFREAVKAGYFDLQSARDRYRFAVGPHGMHADLASKYIEVRVHKHSHCHRSACVQRLAFVIEAIAIPYT